MDYMQYCVLTNKDPWERHVYTDVLMSRSELFLAEFSRFENSLTIETEARERRRRDCWH